MNKTTPIVLAVRLALYGTAAAPALLATGVGIAHGRVAEPIARCEQGQELAVCAGQATEAHEGLHLHELTGLPEPQVVNVPLGRMVMTAPQTIEQAGAISTGGLPAFIQTGYQQAVGTPLPLAGGSGA